MSVRIKLHHTGAKRGARVFNKENGGHLVLAAGQTKEAVFRDEYAASIRHRVDVDRAHNGARAVIEIQEWEEIGSDSPLPPPPPEDPPGPEDLLIAKTTAASGFLESMGINQQEPALEQEPQPEPEPEVVASEPAPQSRRRRASE